MYNDCDGTEKLGDSHVLYSLIKIASRGEKDGYHFDPDTTIGIIFGEKSVPYRSGRVCVIEELFTGTEGFIFVLPNIFRKKYGANFP